jgi:hypothetical protein
MPPQTRRTGWWTARRERGPRTGVALCGDIRAPRRPGHKRRAAAREDTPAIRRVPAHVRRPISLVPRGRAPQPAGQDRRPRAGPDHARLAPGRANRTSAGQPLHAAPTSPRPGRCRRSRLRLRPEASMLPLLLLACVAPNPSPADQAPPPLPGWTIAVWMDGDNDLEPLVPHDLDELERGMDVAGADVRVLVQADRIDGYSTRDGDWTGTRRYDIAPDAAPGVASPWTDLSERDMGDPAELAEFLEWAHATSPTEHLAVVLWNHGGGFWIAQDDTSGSLITITGELQDALQPVIDTRGAPLDLVAFDACNMAEWELAHALAPQADVLVASEAWGERRRPRLRPRAHRPRRHGRRARPRRPPRPLRRRPRRADDVRRRPAPAARHLRRRRRPRQRLARPPRRPRRLRPGPPRRRPDGPRLARLVGRPRHPRRRRRHQPRRPGRRRRPGGRRRRRRRHHRLLRSDPRRPRPHRLGRHGRRPLRPPLHHRRLGRRQPPGTSCSPPPPAPRA